MLGSNLGRDTGCPGLEFCDLPQFLQGSSGILPRLGHYRNSSFSCHPTVRQYIHRPKITYKKRHIWLENTRSFAARLNYLSSLALQKVKHLQTAGMFTSDIFREV